MAVPSNTVQTFAMNGIREDLSDTIYNIAPTETPFMSMCTKGKAKQRNGEWQIDDLAAANDENKVIEGDDASNDVAGHPTRVGTWTQLMDKVVQVSSTAEAVDHAGYKSAMSYQVAKRGKEIKRDMEKRALSKKPSVSGGASTPGETAGVGAWLTTNTSRGTGGADGGFSGGVVAAPTNGTDRALTEAMFKANIQSCWDNGGDPTKIFANSSQKVNISGFGGIATQYRENTGTKQAVILGAADIYVSDFGNHTVIPDRFMPTDCIYNLDSEYWEICHLQAFKTEDLAKTGHSKRKMLSVEWLLKSKNEAANGVIDDLL